METSDSECFESADEEVRSDDEGEDKKSVKANNSSKVSEKKNAGGDSVTKPCVVKGETFKIVEKTGVDDEKRQSVLPARTECWEPGMNYDSVETSCEKSEQIGEIQQDDKQEIKSCKKAQAKCQVPPAVSSSGLDLKDQDTKKSDKNSGNRPEYGIPPAISTCWIPGTSNQQQPFQPHPAYLDLIKKKSEDTKESAPCKNANLPAPVDSEENMWENDGDWDDFDPPATQSTKTIPSKISDKESDDNMWEDDCDDWEPLETKTKQDVEKRPQNEINDNKSSWGGWGNWGLSTVISTASSLTTQVSQGISTVLETSIGAPDPAELAKINQLEKEKLKEVTTTAESIEEKSTSSFGFGNLMQEVTKLVESTGTKMISGGLDTLETIGKKTMEVLQENDPGLKRKRAFLKLDDNKPILSQLLREAKEKVEKENKELEKKHFAKKANYETIFDDHQGLVHLEALEMLSKQCDIKLQSLLEAATGDALTEIQETVDQVKELCELPEEDEDETVTIADIKEKLNTAVGDINIKISYDKLLLTWEEVDDWLKKLNLNVCNKNELHQQAIESLAQLTALAVEQFHKTGELLLVKEHRSTADEADSLVQLTTTLTLLIGQVAGKFSEKLNAITVDGAEKDEVNGFITNVFFEAANSSSYIQDAFQLLIPVLLIGAV